MGLNTKLKEAEVYSSMGLTEESIGIYEQILSENPELDAKGYDEITKKISLLKDEIADFEKSDRQTVSAEEVSAFKEGLAGVEEVPAILDSAAAFSELGLDSDAVSEYEKLFKLDYPLEKLVPEIAKGLLKLHSPSRVAEQMEGIIGRQDLEEKEKANIKFLLGMEMEKRDHKNIALDLYELAQASDPKNEEIKGKLSSLAASVSSGSKYDYLLNQKMVTTTQLQKALAISKKTEKSVEWILIEKFKVKKELVGKSLSLFHGCPFRTYDPDLPNPIALMGNLKKAFLLHELWVPLNWGKKGIEILIDDPRDLSKTDHIRTSLKTKKIYFSVAIKEDIESFIKSFFAEKKRNDAVPVEDMEEDFGVIPDVSFEEEEEEEIEEVDESSGQLVRLVDQVLLTAFRKGASDVHIEPSPELKATSIRFRLDGVCQEHFKVPIAMARGIISRVKIMAGLDIAEKRLPQDGKIKFRRKGIPQFELRVATLPTAGGFEDAVLRILANAGALKMDEMGLNERNLKIMKDIVLQPYGLVLVVGPTGSGKTTSLHAALGHINNPGIKIWTAEEPVEITQSGLRQVEAKPKIGLNFARIMRAFLRADPDVIMIGEMRDQETAAIGIEASLTGHLVFSTLHTNSAPETVTRLLDMGLNPLNFSDSFLGVMAQRLVRRLCKECREEFHPSQEEFDEIVSDYGVEHFEATGIKLTSDLTLYRPGKCDACSQTGYKGRLGIHELLVGTPEIKRLIKKQADSEILFQQGIKDGMTTLKQDGIMKVFQGLTDLNEVRRVCIV